MQLTQLDHSLIAGLEVFQGMAAADLDRVLRQAQSLRVPKNAAVFREDEEARSFFLLLDGYVRVAKTTANGQQVIVRYISPGELLGIANALGRETYPASAIAAVDCVVLAWPGKLWPEFAAAFPNFGANTYKAVGARLLDAQTRVVEMSTELVQQRVAHALLRLAEQTGRRTKEGVVIDFPLSRQDIAEMTGSTLHTVSRLLTAWEEKGLVRSGRQRVTLLEECRLAALSQGQPEIM